MPSSSKKDSLVFVHHKKTGEVEVRRRTSNSTTRPASSTTSLSSHLHYIDPSRSHVCNCSDSNSRASSSPVASDSQHLAAAITRFLDLHNFRDCSIAQFRTYEVQIKGEWERDGIFVNDCHYATVQKDVVCRCTAPNNHGQGPVRNPDIAELCAIFCFQLQGR